MEKELFYLNILMAILQLKVDMPKILIFVFILKNGSHQQKISSTDIHIDKPFRYGTVFPYYQIGIGGDASVFNFPRNFWSTSSQLQRDNYVVLHDVTIKINTYLIFRIELHFIQI